MSPQIPFQQGKLLLPNGMVTSKNKMTSSEGKTGPKQISRVNINTGSVGEVILVQWS